MNDRFFFIDTEKESDTRFDLSKFFQWTDNYDPLTSYVYSELSNLPVEGFFKIQGQDGRPDQISYEIYTDTQYWWVLMIYNDIQSVEQFVSGMDIKYPSITSLEDMYFSLKINEQSVNKTT